MHKKCCSKPNERCPALICAGAKAVLSHPESKVAGRGQNCGVGGSSGSSHLPLHTSAYGTYGIQYSLICWDWSAWMTYASILLSSFCHLPWPIFPFPSSFTRFTISKSASPDELVKRNSYFRTIAYFGVRLKVSVRHLETIMIVTEAIQIRLN